MVNSTEGAAKRDKDRAQKAPGNNIWLNLCIVLEFRNQ